MKIILIIHVAERKKVSDGQWRDGERERERRERERETDRQTHSTQRHHMLVYKHTDII